MKNRSLFSVLVLATAMLLQACATAPKPPEARPHHPPQGQPQPPPPAMNDNGEGEKLDPVVAEAARAYTRTKKNGVLMFCKRERESGSRLMTTVCLTEAQLRDQVEAMKKFRNDSMQQGHRCQNGPSCSGG